MFRILLSHHADQNPVTCGCNMKWNWIILKIILVKSSELKIDIILCYSVLRKTSRSTSAY